MKPLLNFVKTTLIGGLFFLIPLFLVIVLLKKIFVIARKITDPIVSNLPDSGFFGFGLNNLSAIILLIIICFLAGIFGKIRMGRRLIDSIEEYILNKLPGYAFIKSITSGVVGVEEKKLPVVMVRVDDGWQIAFLVDKVDEKLSAVFVPNAPNPWSGSVYFIENEKIQAADLSQGQAFNCLKKLGINSSTILGNKINVSIK